MVVLFSFYFAGRFHHTKEVHNKLLSKSHADLMSTGLGCLEENTIHRKSTFESSGFSLGSARHPLLLPGSYSLVSSFYSSLVYVESSKILRIKY